MTSKSTRRMTATTRRVPTTAPLVTKTLGTWFCQWPGDAIGEAWPTWDDAMKDAQQWHIDPWMRPWWNR